MTAAIPFSFNLRRSEAEEQLARIERDVDVGEKFWHRAVPRFTLRACCSGKIS